MSLLIFTGVANASPLSSDASPEKLAENFHLLNQKEKVKVHSMLQKILASRAQDTKFQDKVILEDFTTSNNFKKILIGILISEALADSENPELFCNFGGWISTFDSNDRCQAPWRSAVKNDARLEIFGPTLHGRI